MRKYFVSRLSAFTLTELLVVLIIIGILILMALPRLMPLISRAKSTEARYALGHLHTLQKTYYMEHSRYSDDLDELGFEQEPLTTEGGSSNYLVEIISVTEQGFIGRASAVVDFDGDGNYDTWEIDQDKNMTQPIKD